MYTAAFLNNRNFIHFAIKQILANTEELFFTRQDDALKWKWQFRRQNEGKKHFGGVCGPIFLL